MTIDSEPTEFPQINDMAALGEAFDLLANYIMPGRIGRALTLISRIEEFRNRQAVEEYKQGIAPVEDDIRVDVSFTLGELYALSQFLNDDGGDDSSGELSDQYYKPLKRKLFVAAAKAGLYDEIL